MNDETIGKRHRIKDRNDENNYIYIDSTAVSMAIAYENRIENRLTRELVERTCENATSLLESGIAMGSVADYVEKQNAGRCSLLGKMAGIMRGHCR